MDKLTNSLWDHQRRAVDFMGHHPSCLLAMDMGTGKSRCIVEAVKKLQPKSRVLIICPRSVLGVWNPEFRKFYDGKVGKKGNPWDDLVVTTLDQNFSASRKATLLEKLDQRFSDLELSATRVVVVNYESAVRPELLKYWNKYTWDLIVVDESHRIKSATGSTSKAIAKLRGKRRVCLTGTPMPHSPLDMFGQARFLDPTVFGKGWTKFRSEYAVMGGYCVNGRPVQVKGFRNMDRFEKKCAEFTFQVKADDVLDLPERHHVVRRCSLPEKIRAGYERLEKDFVTWLESGEAVIASNVLDKLGKLMQYTSGHARYDDDANRRIVEVVHNAKKDALQEILEDNDPGEPIVVFALFTPDLDAIAEAAIASKRQCFELSGRRNELKTWQDDTEGSVIAVQLQAGGVGISLVRSRICCYYSMGFNLGDYEQSLARVHRPGQDRSVTYFHLTVPNSVDDQVYRALTSRKNVVDEVMRNVKSIEPETAITEP